MATTNLFYDLPYDIQDIIWNMKSKLDFQETIDFIKNNNLSGYKMLNPAYRFFLIMADGDDVYDPSQKVHYNGKLIGETIVSISA